MEDRETPFLFVGNQLCLDFINTTIMSEGQQTSLILNFADLKRWLQDAGVAREIDIDRITGSWDAGNKEQFTQQALAFRDMLREMADQITAGQSVSDEVINTINHWLKQHSGYPVLGRTESGYQATVHYELGAGGLVAPIAEAAADLLVHGDLTMVRKCENPQCILYFYDISKNHARRWCSMGMCGNRMKVAAHYRRSRKQGA